jgi:hypothetical protein
LHADLDYWRKEEQAIGGRPQSAIVPKDVAWTVWISRHKSGRAWNRTAFVAERRIAALRIELRESVLGEYGARADVMLIGNRVERVWGGLCY